MHIVLYSGGLASWRVADLVIEEHGVEDVVLLFTDTRCEDADLYRFLDETSAAFGVELTRIAEGRDVWEVFFDVKMIGNTRVDPCSRVLKREPTRRWLCDNADPERDVIYLGFDMFEDHRYQRALEHWSPWTIEAPLVERIETRPMIQAMLEARGIAIPRLYTLGFSHNNCGGACVKAGQGHWAHVLRELPEIYEHWEEREQAFRERFDKDVAILRDQRGGSTTPLTLAELRRRIEADEQVDLFDIRGCGCFASAG